MEEYEIMRRRYELFVYFVVSCLLGAALGLAVAGCHAPPNLTPQATTAWHGTRVIHAIDVIRDIAIDGAATRPPVVSETTARRVVTWHRSALLTIHARSEERRVGKECRL